MDIEGLWEDFLLLFHVWVFLFPPVYVSCFKVEVKFCLYTSQCKVFKTYRKKLICRINEWPWNKWKIFLIDEVNCTLWSAGMPFRSAESQVSFIPLNSIYIIYQYSFNKHLLSTYKVPGCPSCNVLLTDCLQMPSSCFSPYPLCTQLSPHPGFSFWSPNWPLGNQKLF